MILLIFALFSISLITCVMFDFSILFALVFGFILFFSYGLIKGFSFKNMILFSYEGIKQVKGMLLIFILIGMMTAIWRAAGTIPMIIELSSSFLKPSIFILVVFLMNCFVSVLTGSAFGTVATVGVICMTIGNVMGENPLFLGGAIFSGIYFGDRCSPMSTSALLVSELTKVDIFLHIRQMIRTGLIPFILTVIVYLALGLLGQATNFDHDATSIFTKSFTLNEVTLIPAILIFALLLFKVKIKNTMLFSIIAGTIICLTVQQMSFRDVFFTLWNGYEAKSDELGLLLNGGGIVSMLHVIAVVCISSSYFGIFNGTNLLEHIQKSVTWLASKSTNFITSTFVSIITAMISCNQTLTIMLTFQLTKDLKTDNKWRANMLADTAVVIPPLIPWTIAGIVPLTTINAPVTSLLFACYLYLLPLCGMIRSYTKDSFDLSRNVGSGVNT